MCVQAIKHTERTRSLKRLYAIDILSTAIGLTVIVILNMFNPLAILLVTLITLRWLVGHMEITAKDYGQGIQGGPGYEKKAGDAQP